MIERIVTKNVSKPFRMLRVFLGDSLQECVTGGSTPLTLRDRIKIKKEADVLIDAKAPLLLAILKWCHKTIKKDKRVVLDATPEHFNSLKQILNHFDYVVLDMQETSDKKNLKELKDIPRLIYHPTTSATVNAVFALISSGQADPAKCCVLINSPFGLEHLQDLKDEFGHQFEAICAAEIYDDYFRQVRVWSRVGHSAGEIQQELDVRFEKVIGMQMQIKAQNVKSQNEKSGPPDPIDQHLKTLHDSTKA